MMLFFIAVWMDLLLIASVNLINNLVDSINWRSLVLLACGLFDKVSNLTLIHHCKGGSMFCLN